LSIANTSSKLVDLTVEKEKTVLSFGYMEIGILVLLLCFVLGAGKTGEFLGRIFHTYRKVGQAKQDLKSSLNPVNLFGKNHRDRD